MAKAKIYLEIDQHILANAQAYVKQHGGSLDTLVSAFFSTFGVKDGANAPMPDPTTRVLMEVSSGQTALVEGARILGMQDAGHLLQKLRDAGLPLPQLSESDSRGLADAASTAFTDCLLETGGDNEAPQRKMTPAVSE
jgi:hypothetical protein